MEDISIKDVGGFPSKKNGFEEVRIGFEVGFIGMRTRRVFYKMISDDIEHPWEELENAFVRTAEQAYFAALARGL